MNTNEKEVILDNLCRQVLQQHYPSQSFSMGKFAFVFREFLVSLATALFGVPGPSEQVEKFRLKNTILFYKV